MREKGGGAAGASSSSEGATAVAALSVTAAFGLVATGFQPVSRASLTDIYIYICIYRDTYSQP